MDWREAAWGLGGLAVGFLASLLKAILPGYGDLVKENRELRAECADWMEKCRGLEDILRETEESADARTDRSH